MSFVDFTAAHSFNVWPNVITIHLTSIARITLELLIRPQARWIGPIASAKLNVVGTDFANANYSRNNDTTNAV